MNRGIPFLLLLALCSCTIWSLHPATPEGSTGAGPGILEGSWEVTEIVDQALSAFPVIEVAPGDPGELTLTMRGGAQEMARRAILVDLDGMRILSIQSDTGNWNIVKIELDQGDQVMRIFALDAEALIQARDAGELAVTDPGISFDGAEIEIRENQADLARFLRENPDSFVLQVASLRRMGGGGQ